MPSIKGSRVRDIEMAHKLGEVAIRGAQQEVKMVGHTDIGENANIVDI